MKERPNRLHHGFTLIELLSVMVILSALAAIVVPMASRITAAARAVHCMNNLRAIGAGLQGYLADNNNNLPTLVMARESSSDDQPAMDTVLKPYVSSLDVFHCVADNKNLYQTTGSSYLWNSLVNGQNIASMDFMTISNDGSRIPIISDKENFHQYQKVQVNILYADGHASKDIQFVTTSSSQ